MNTHSTLTLENLPVKLWSSDDQPREKLIQKGKRHLSNTELLAIAIGSGSKDESVLDLSKRILNSVNNDLTALGKLCMNDLIQFKGIGQAKAAIILAIMELANRKGGTKIEYPQILDCEDVYKCVYPLFSDLDHEEFWILLLNSKNRVIKKQRISIGGINKTLVDHRILFRKALEGKAASIILCHNHPSGDPTPSNADCQLTSQLVRAGNIIGLSILDHLIFAGAKYYSFVEEGTFPSVGV